MYKKRKNINLRFKNSLITHKEKNKIYVQFFDQNNLTRVARIRN